MLKEIYCDKFAQNRIEFHNGLNVVAGDENASNSIGKSSALLAIEYAFGGSTYAEQDDIIQNVGHHQICFCHSFNGRDYYFRRSTDTPSTISVCDSRYVVQKEETLQDLFDFILSNYGVSHYALSFRDFVGLFSRIYGKDNLNERNPLHVISKEAGSKTIIRLLKIFDLYQSLEEQRIIKEVSEKRLSTFNNAQKISLLDPIKNKKEKDQVISEIALCDSNIESISAQIASNSALLDNQQLDAIAIQRNRQQMIGTIISKKKIQLRRLQKNLAKTGTDCVVDTNQLSLYFPTINIKQIDEINAFHGHITEILKKQILEEISQCQESISEQIKLQNEVTEEIKKIVDCKNPATIAIDNLIKLKAHRDSLYRRIEDSQKYLQFVEEKRISAANYSVMITKSLTGVQQLLNNQMSELCEVVTAQKNAPQLALRETEYEFFILNDTGAGSKYKSTILLDLSFLKLTDLPFVIHDTVLFKNIEDDTLENIILQYHTFEDKQVFIAFDHIESYAKEVADVLKENTSICLAPGGRELYGKSWNVKK